MVNKVLRVLTLAAVLLVARGTPAGAFDWYTHLWITHQVSDDYNFMWSSELPDLLIPIPGTSQDSELTNMAHSPAPKPLQKTTDRWSGLNYDDTNPDNKLLFGTNSSYVMYSLAELPSQRMMAAGLGAHLAEDAVAHQLWPISDDALVGLEHAQIEYALDYYNWVRNLVEGGPLPQDKFEGAYDIDFIYAWQINQTMLDQMRGPAGPTGDNHYYYSYLTTADFPTSSGRNMQFAAIKAYAASKKQSEEDIESRIGFWMLVDDTMLGFLRMRFNNQSKGKSPAEYWSELQVSMKLIATHMDKDGNYVQSPYYIDWHSPLCSGTEGVWTDNVLSYAVQAVKDYSYDPPSIKIQNWRPVPHLQCAPDSDPHGVLLSHDPDATGGCGKPWNARYCTTGWLPGFFERIGSGFLAVLKTAFGGKAAYAQSEPVDVGAVMAGFYYAAGQRAIQLGGMSETTANIPANADHHQLFDVSVQIIDLGKATEAFHQVTTEYLQSHPVDSVEYQIAEFEWYAAGFDKTYGPPPTPTP